MNKKRSLFLISSLLIVLLLLACNEKPAEDTVEDTEEVENVQEDVDDSEENDQTVESEASQYLSGETFNKYTGDGAERLLFVDDHTLIISVEDNLPPYISNLEDIEDFEESETIEFENIELMDIETGDSDSKEFLVIYDGEELLKLMINEDNLLETNDGTTYMKN